MADPLVVGFLDSRHALKGVTMSEKERVYWRHYAPGTHALCFSAGKREFYFSYSTLVAFKPSNGGLTRVQKNRWGTTTGGHLNAIDGGSVAIKKARLDKKDFDRLLEGELG